MVLSKHARSLKRKGYNIILIDKNQYHTYTPTLYEISTTSKKTANYIDLQSVVTYPIEDLIGDKIEFKQAEVEKIDTRKGEVLLKDADPVPYSHLILGIGTQTRYFDIEGLEQKALPLKTFKDALNIRETIWALATSAKTNDEINVVIGGAGPTGVELTAELQEWFAELKKEGVRCNMKTTLVDASNRILSRLDKKIADKATKRLQRLGANIITKARVEKVKKDKITLSGDMRIRYDVLIWTGGVKAPENILSLPLKQVGQRGLIVDKYMRTKPKRKNQKMKGDIYAIGDIAVYKKSIPQMARPAISQGAIAAHNIISQIKKRPLKEFKPWKYPYIVPTGGKHSLAKIGNVILSGLLGWLLKGLVELNYLISIMPINRALRIWIKGLQIFIKNDRLG